MTTQRAKEVYDKHCNSSPSPFTRSAIDKFLTNDERGEVMAKWKTMPGHSCFNDAFFSFMEYADLPPYMRNRQFTTSGGEP